DLPLNSYRPGTHPRRRTFHPLDGAGPPAVCREGRLLQTSMPPWVAARSSLKSGKKGAALPRAGATIGSHSTRPTIGAAVMVLPPQRLRRHVRDLVPHSPASTEAELLARFVRCRDEDAFAALVARHGSMVLGVCRRALRDANLAEDVAQATFLALAR